MKLINFLLLLILLFLIYIFQLSPVGFFVAVPGLLLTFYRDKIISSKRSFVVLLLLVLAMPISLSCKNLISNPGFEEGLAGWDWIAQVYRLDGNNYAISKVDATAQPRAGRSGNNAFTVINRQESGDQRYGLLYQQLKVWPRATYNLTFYVKGNIPQSGLRVSIGDEWFRDKALYSIPQGSYEAWTKQGPIKLLADDSHYANLKIISTEPGQFFVDDLSLTLNIWDSLKGLLPVLRPVSSIRGK